MHGCINDIAFTLQLFEHALLTWRSCVLVLNVQRA